MPTDMLWRQHQPVPPRRPKRQLGYAFVSALVVINVGVVAYHGDPRDKFAALTGDESPAPPKLEARAPTALDGDASAFSESDGIDPLLGLRSPRKLQRVASVTLGRGQLPAHALREIGVGDDAIASSFASLNDLVDFRRMRPGHAFEARFSGDDELLSLRVKMSVLEEVETRFDEGEWRAEKIEKQVESVVDHISGGVESSLWNAVVATGENPALIPAFVDIFAWEIDFYRDVQAGDSFEVLVEKRYVDGDFIGYGDILAARYTNVGEQRQAFLERRVDDGAAFYYNESGESLRKQLLKAPLKYGRVTSGFGKRRHPILGYGRQHNGVDYGVPHGTAVWSVGDGRVVRAGWAGGYGNLVAVRHNNGWLSQYAHLSKINVKVGQKIRQKDIVGKVGSTGMSTGPHLHYELKKNGSFVNPAAQLFERAKPLAGDNLVAFRSRVADYTRQLDRARVARSALEPSTPEG